MVAKRSPEQRAAIPLRYRLPNPPTLFVGRERDLEWLGAALGRAPLTMVAGPSGVGKTALVLQALHQRLKKRVSRVVYFARQPDGTQGQLDSELLRELHALYGQSPLDWTRLSADDDSRISTLLELTEKQSAWVVIDALDCGSGEALALLSKLASYARRSHWVVCSSMVPDLPALAGQALSLDALPAPMLIQLARHWAPEAPESRIKQAAHICAGSPWMLHQLLWSHHDTFAGDGAYLLAELNDAVRAFVEVLAHLDAPLPIDVLRRVAPDPGEEGIELLRRRGLLRRAVNGWILHPIARRQARGAQRAADPVRRALARALLAEHPPHAWLQAMRLFSTDGHIDELLDALALRAAGLMSQGYVPHLWNVLRPLNDLRLRGWQLECAAQLGNPTALTSVADPRSDDPQVLLMWANKLLAEGKVAATMAVAQQLLDRHAADGRGERGAAGESARLLLAQCLRHRGEFAATTALCEAGTDQRQLAQRIQARAERGDALEQAEVQLLEQLLHQGLLTHHELAMVHHLTGDRQQALQVLAQVDGAKRGSHVALLETRRALLLKARIFVDHGELDRAASQLDALRPYCRGASLLRPFMLATDLERRLAAGRLEGLAEAVAQARIVCAQVDVGCLARIEAVDVRRSMLQADAPRDVSAVPDSVEARRSAKWRRIALARHGSSRDASPPGVQSGSRHEWSVLSGLAEASAELAAGHWAAGANAAQLAFDDARRAQLSPLVCEALFLWCDAALCAGDRGGAAERAKQLGAVAKPLGSARYWRLGELQSALSQEVICPSSLELFAAGEQLSPLAARRCQALLGGSPVLDRIDERVVKAIGSSPALGAIRQHFAAVPDPGGAGRWSAGWGLDFRHQRVWLADGKVVALGSSPLSWSLLVILSKHGERSKEQLAQALWPTEAYHPFTHDGRLYVAVRKLRAKIEVSASQPQRLLTTDQGYRLGGCLRSCANIE